MRFLITATIVLFSLAALLLVIDRGREKSVAETDPAPEISVEDAPEETVAPDKNDKDKKNKDKKKTNTLALYIINSAGERVSMVVELAQTDREKRKGLMGRTELGENRGMLFIFDREQPLSFWMKNTLIPLSVAYIDGGGTIVDIQDMQPLDETSHPSAAPAKYALEANQGFFEAHGINVGDRLE